MRFVFIERTLRCIERVRILSENWQLIFKIMNTQHSQFSSKYFITPSFTIPVLSNSASKIISEIMPIYFSYSVPPLPSSTVSNNSSYSYDISPLYLSSLISFTYNLPRMILLPPSPLLSYIGTYYSSPYLSFSS